MLNKSHKSGHISRRKRKTIWYQEIQNMYLKNPASISKNPIKRKLLEKKGIKKTWNQKVWEQSQIICLEY